MREIASIEIGKALSEMEERLRESRLRKFYDLGEGSFRFLFYRKEGNVHVYCKLLRAFNETEFTEGADEATPFAMGIRKRLENSTLTGIKQHGSDRMIVLDFGKEGYRLIIEMFGKGNMILINTQGRIELCYKTVRYRERSVAPGSPYEFPRSESIPFESIDRKALEDLLDAAPEGKKLIRYLSDHVNIGPIYLEDIIKRSGLDPGGVVDKGIQYGLLVDGILGFFARVAKEKPRLYVENGEPKDYAIVDVKRYEGLESIEYPSLNSLLDEMLIRERTEKVDKGKEDERMKMNASMEAQKQLVVSAKAEAEYYANAGRRIFETMHVINKLIEYLARNRNAKLEEVRKEFGSSIGIKGLDLKDKTVRIEIEG